MRHAIDYDIDLAPTGFAAAAGKKGPVSGMTDPAATPPTSGAYTAQVLSNQVQSFEGRISVALGVEPEPGGTMPPTAIAPTFANHPLACRPRPHARPKCKQPCTPEPSVPQLLPFHLAM